MTVLYNLVRVNSTSTGTGSASVGSAVSPWLSFSTGNVTSGSYVTYAIQDATNSEIGQGTYTSSNNAVTRTKILASTNGGAAINLTGTQQLYLTASAQDFQGFQCGKLTAVSSGSIRFSPFNGDLVRINGSAFQIPAAGVSATSTNTYVGGSSAATLATSTVYLVTVFNNAGTLTLDFLAGAASSTPAAHTTDTGAINTGVEIPSTTGNSSRTVIGMVKVSSAAVAFVDSATQRWTRSWLNENGVTGFNNLSSNVTSTSATSDELNSAKRVEFLTWSSEQVSVGIIASAFNDTSIGRCGVSVGINSCNVSQPAGSLNILTNVNDRATLSAIALVSSLGEGSNFATILGGQVNAGTATYTGDADGRRTAINIQTLRR